MMATITPYNDKYRKWGDIDLSENPFALWQSILAQLDIDITAALEFFTLDYYSAVTNYTDRYILVVFGQVLLTSGGKYQRMISAAKATYNPIHNVDATESYTDTRSPNLTKSLMLGTTTEIEDTRGTTTTLGTTVESETQINQTHKTEYEPENFKTTSTHSVNPYDNTGWHEEQKDESTESGKSITSDSYTGDPDKTTTKNMGQNRSENDGKMVTKNMGQNQEKEEGTETIEHNARRYGNIGVTSSQNLVGQELDLAERLNIFKVIEQDIAAKLFLQVWI